jgi:hypothetical protein
MRQVPRQVPRPERLCSSKVQCMDKLKNVRQIRLAFPCDRFLVSQVRNYKPCSVSLQNKDSASFNSIYSIKTSLHSAWAHSFTSPLNTTKTTPTYTHCSTLVTKQSTYQFFSIFRHFSAPPDMLIPAQPAATTSKGCSTLPHWFFPPSTTRDRTSLSLSNTASWNDNLHSLSVTASCHGSFIPRT